ncbi:hypothetical protein L6164_026513 [Bauhinia variegata]|uniref:Uncharacterized protein n=1 Tax=Bauhinia variegata TaxID=167791 RepID=A0ACB9LQ51_BAUVA|nr:hypothetical protein L6164_026513 [Bauhinia variegata]
MASSKITYYESNTYIVYMGNGKVDEVSALSLYTSMLQEVVDSKAAERPILHHYKRSFNGFVVKLTDEEVKRIADTEMDGVVSVFPNEMKQLHTTSKIVGAKYYKTDGTFSPEDLRSPRDSNGHGAYVASTAAGMPVDMPSMLGFGLGTARGAIPSARIAVYKVCWVGCAAADILAAFDDATADGVDILSGSLGGPANRKYFDDSVDIGAFHAMTNGILTVTSAGNSGPSPATLSNFSSWSISVGASTMDRKFVTKVELGDRKKYEGVSINTFDLKGDMYPLIYSRDAANTSGGSSLARFCSPNTLDPKLVKGKIVLCDGDFSSIATTSTFLAVAVRVLTQGETRRDYTSIFPLPGSYLNSHDGPNTSIYLNSTRDPTATIFRSEEVKNTLAPAVVSFSSRGPNRLTPDILKGYPTRFLRRVTGDNSGCPETTNATTRDLNYPSFALQTQLAKPTNATFKRTVTNVGSSVSTYKATVTVSSQGLKIQVNHSVLSFTSVGQKKTFELSIEGTIEEPIVSASLVWNDGNFQVRSPIAIYHIE